jgi:DNA-binding MarR family transcriptional regulator
MLSEPQSVVVVDTAIGIAADLETELGEALDGHRLSRSSYLVLDALGRAEAQTLTQRALVDAVRRTSGTLSVRLGRLERAGMIGREPQPENRRSVTVTLTERGAALLEAARPAYAERAQRLVAGLPDEAAEQVAAGLRSWLAFLEPGESTAPRLAVSVAAPAVATRMRRAVGLPDEPGVLVMRVGEHGPARAAGLSRGDLITAAAGRPVRSIGDLARAVRSADGSVSLSVLRGVEPREVEVALD